MQPGDHDGVVFAERRHYEIAAQEPSAFQVLRDGLRVLADLGELAQNFRKIHGADDGAAKERVLDYIGPRFIVEVGEKGRGIEDVCRVFQIRTWRSLVLLPLVDRRLAHWRGIGGLLGSGKAPVSL
jgi:hypothetical protein